MDNKKIEILAPVGNHEMLSAAINSGADSIYFGISGFNMRAGAKNFMPDEMKTIVSKCHTNGLKAYLALNTIIFEHELEKVKSILKLAKDSGVDAVICYDMAVARFAEKLKIDVHISTQASVSNSSAADVYKKLGAKRIVLARECSLKDIKKIKKKDIEIEVFIHGAMCVSESGRCFMSEHLYGKSANRGECIQPCRRAYKITDTETKKELVLDNNYVMSPKDMCTIMFIEKLIDAGINCFKIEGRNRSPEYVKITVEVYKQAIELYSQKKLTLAKKKQLYKKLQKVYNRGFSDGFYMGKPIGDWAESYGSQSTMVKEYVGYVVNYFKTPKVAEIKLQSGHVKLGDKILIIGPTTGCVEEKITSMQVNKKPIKSAKKPGTFALKIPLVRKNDKVYLWKKR